MATRGTINELYDISSLDKQQKAVLDFVKQYVDAVKSASAIKIQLGDSKSARDISAAIKQLNLEQQKLVDLQLKLAKAETEYAKARLTSNKADTESVKTKKQQVELEIKVTKEKERLTKAAEKEMKAIEKANNEYIKLNEQYKAASAASLKRGAELLKEANGNEKLFQSLLKTDKEYLATTKSAKTYNDQLLQLEQNVGRSQRNVGNYASAFNGLNTSFARVAQELPSLNVSFQTFALAISNNLPIVAEEITRAKAAIAALKAEGQAAPSLFSQIAKSLFSFQVGLSIGITLFVTYADEIKGFFSELFTGKKTIDAIAESQKDLNEINSEGTKEYTKQKIELDALIVVATDENKTKLERSAAIKKINDQMPDYIGNLTLENIKTEEGTRILAAYTSELQKKALAQAFITKIQSLSLQLVDAENSSIEENITLYDRFIGVLKGIGPGGAFRRFTSDTERGAENLENKIKGINEQISILQGQLNTALQNGTAKLDLFSGNDKVVKDKSADDRKRNLEEEFKARRESIIKSLEDDAELQKTIIENESNSYAVRIKAAENFYLVKDAIASANKTTELIELQKKQDELKLSDEQVAEQRLLIDQKYASEILKNARENAALVKSIQKEQLEETDRLRTEFEDKEIKRIEQSFKRNKTLLEKQRDEQLLDLENQFSDGLIKREEYEKEKERIQEEFNAKGLQAELEYYTQLLGFLKSIGADTLELERKIAEARLKLKQDSNRKLTKADQEFADEQKRLVRELQQEVFNLAKTFTLGRFDAAKNAIQDQIDKTEEAKRKEIDAINATTLSAQEKQARISNAEKKAQNERERLEQRQRQLDRQRAQFERAFAIAQIIQNQAVAIAKIFKDYTFVAGLPLAALMASIGAVQIASVLAQPIPKFKTGKGAYDDYEGPAWVGDGGKSEMIFREDGSVERTPATPVMTWVGKNDIIHPDADAWLNHTLKKQGEVYPYNMASMLAFGEMNTTLKEVGNQIERSITNKREWIVNLNNGKPSIMSKDGSRVKQYLNDNLQFGK